MRYVQEALDVAAAGEGPPAAETTGRGASLLDVRRIYGEPAALASPRGRQVLQRWPRAEVVEVESHWAVPELHCNAGDVERWVRVKAETLVLGEKKSLTARRNGRSADWIAPSTANGCAMACAYCYVPRGCSTCARHRWRSGSPPWTTSWRPVTRSTSTCPRSSSGPAGRRTGQTCCAVWTTSCRRHVRYHNGLKRDAVERLRSLVAQHAPWLTVRYAF